MTQADLITEIVVRLGTDTTVAFYTDAILERWIDQAHRWGAGYHKWPFTEGKVTTTYTTVEAKLYPEGWRSDSIRLLQIGTDTPSRLQKLNFEDYQIYRENNPSGTDRVYSDFAGEFYINPNIDLSGTTTVWGQYTPAPLTGDTVFTGREDEGNEAIINEVLSYAMTREKKTQEAIAYHSLAKETLDTVWTKIQQEQSLYQTKDRGMYGRIDVLNGLQDDEIFRRDQFI